MEGQTLLQEGPAPLTENKGEQTTFWSLLNFSRGFVDLTARRALYQLEGVVLFLAILLWSNQFCPVKSTDQLALFRESL